MGAPLATKNVGPGTYDWDLAFFKKTQIKKIQSFMSLTKTKTLID